MNAYEKEMRKRLWYGFVRADGCGETIWFKNLGLEGIPASILRKIKITGNDYSWAANFRDFKRWLLYHYSEYKNVKLVSINKEDHRKLNVWFKNEIPEKYNTADPVYEDGLLKSFISHGHRFVLIYKKDGSLHKIKCAAFVFDVTKGCATFKVGGQKFTFRQNESGNNVISSEDGNFHLELTRSIEDHHSIIQGILLQGSYVTEFHSNDHYFIRNKTENGYEFRTNGFVISSEKNQVISIEDNDGRISFRCSADDHPEDLQYLIDYFSHSMKHFFMKKREMITKSFENYNCNYNLHEIIQFTEANVFSQEAIEAHIKANEPVTLDYSNVRSCYERTPYENDELEITYDEKGHITRITNKEGDYAFNVTIPDWDDYTEEEE